MTLLRGAMVLLALAGGAAGCAGQIPEPELADAERVSGRWPETSVAGLVEGRRLYIDRCSGCHTLYRPAAYRPEQWAAMVEEMTERARLDRGQVDAIVRYLVAAAGRPR